MEKELRALLLQFDDEEKCEAPDGFDYSSSLQAVMKVKERIERTLSVELELDTSIQDASFFADLRILDKEQKLKKDNGESYVGAYDLAIRFSAFGKFATVFSNTGKEIETKNDIIEILESEGYIFVEDSLLDEIYDGINKYIGANDTWWIRYFDYL